MSDKVKFPWCIIVLIILVSSACSNKPNYAPVRKTHENLNSTIRHHTVKKGETLYSIGFRYNFSYLRLAEWNNISKPYRIRVGQQIKLFRPNNSQSKNSKTTKNTPKKRTTSQNTPKKRRHSSQKKPTLSITKKKVLKLAWQWPIRGGLVKTFSQSGNKGIDISGKFGQSVKAAADGKVVYSGNGLTGYGNLLIIKHNYLYLSAYANNHRLLVVEGQDVRKGQVIAEMGIGKGKKAALHFEIRKNGESVNPLNYLP
jgi:lipoprotein NlpD